MFNGVNLLAKCNKKSSNPKQRYVDNIPKMSQGQRF